MDTILAAFVAIFILLYGALSLSSTMISAQDTLRVASQEMHMRLALRAGTNLVPVSARVVNSGTVVELIYRNEGVSKLADFPQWDVFAQYTDNLDPLTTPVVYHIGRLSFTIGVPISGEWAVSNIYLNADQSLQEVYERGILNPSEEIKLSMNLSPPVGNGKTVQVVLVTANGVSIETQVTRNFLPVLATNLEMSVLYGTTGVIDPTKLAVTDMENSPDALVYTITVPPTQGVLSQNQSFSQDDINKGMLTYTRTGVDNDSFSFTLSDGEDTIGPYLFVLHP